MEHTGSRVYAVVAYGTKDEGVLGIYDSPEDAWDAMHAAEAGSASTRRRGSSISVMPVDVPKGVRARDVSVKRRERRAANEGRQMRLSVGRLRSLVRRGLDEASWRALPPARLSDVLRPMDVEADNTRAAGEEAARRWREETGAPVDPTTVDVQPADDSTELRALSDSPIIFLADENIAYGLEDIGYSIAWHQQPSLGLPLVVWHDTHWNADKGAPYMQGGMVEVGSLNFGPKSGAAEEILAFAFYSPYGLQALDLDDFMQAWDAIRLDKRRTIMHAAPPYDDVVRSVAESAMRE